MYALDNKSGIEQMPEIPEVFSTTPLWFTEGRDGNAPSYPGAHWFNIIQAELLNVLKEAGIEPDKHSLNQLAQALKVLSGQTDSIATLREFEPHRDRQIAFVKGYHAGTAVGGGYFIADFNDSTTADNSGTVIVTASGKRWKRIITNNRLSLEDFGAVADGVTDCGSIINQAFETCAYKYELTAAAGTYVTNTELKAPSGLRFVGAGIDSTIIKAGSRLPAICNLITNKSNNYAVRSVVDQDIEIADMTLNADWRDRYRIGTEINNQACGLKLSSVKACHIKKVKVINAALHCIDVSGDQYVDTGNITDTSQNPSELVVFDMCEAWNPYRDDAFTTHNCGNVVFNQCRAYFDGTVSTLGNTQQGFEADEGSYNITFNDCVATGFMCGYQSKGHATTMPARQVTFNRCVADNCGYSFMASVGTNPAGKVGYKGQAVSFTDCVVNRPNLALNKIALYIYGADGVKVDGFTVNGDAKVVVTQGAGRVDIDNLIFNDELSSNLGIGCIHIESTVTAGVITLRNISSTVAQSLPLVAKTNNATRLHMDNITLNGKGDNGIYLNRNPRDSFVNSRNHGYTNTVYLSAVPIGLTGDVILDSYNQTWVVGSGDKNQSLKAPKGTRMFTPSNGKSWTQVSTDINTPNWTMDIANGDRPHFLSAIIGSEGSTSADLLVHGTARVKTPPANSKNTTVITSEWFHSQFTGNIAANGWEKLPSGRIFQWGSYNADQGNTFDFPIAFNDVFNVYCVDENAGGTAVVSVTVTNKTNTNFTISGSGKVGLFSMWAIGR